MQRFSFPWIWVALAAILLLIPGTAGRLLIDVLGGLTLFLLLLPLLAAGVGFVAWQVIQRRLKTCTNCGAVSFGGDVCPGCGAWLADQPTPPGQTTNSGILDPAQMTINVEAVDVEASDDGTLT